MSNFADSFESMPPNPKRRWWLWVGIGSILLGALAAAWYSDAIPPDDAHMMPSFTEGGGKDNALLIYNSKLKDLRLENFNELANLERIVSEHFQHALQELVSQKGVQAHLPLWNSLLQSDESTWRWRYQDDFPKSLVSDIPKFSFVQGMATLQKMRALHFSLQGNRQAAMDLAFEILKYGNGLAQAEGTILALLVARTVQVMAYDLMQKIVQAHEFTPDELAELQEKISAPNSTVAEINHAIRMEYFYGKTFYLAAAGGGRLKPIFKPIIRRKDCAQLFDPKAKSHQPYGS